ncbi:MAG: DUF2284 domain-containing protein [Ruminococcaceae bacterium]|nr:DUF2284 domain-containing protein [Oscillospiraceae bacterium]
MALATELGAARVGTVAIEDVTFDPVFREICASNACGQYGKCWTCPPDVGEIDRLIEEAKGYSYAMVYQTVTELEDSFDYEGMMEAGNTHNRLAQALRRRMDEMGIENVLHLGAGGCRLCGVCAKKTNEPCRHPALAMRSLEAYGIHVSKLAEAAGMKYINGQNTVTYFGAILIRE